MPMDSPPNLMWDPSFDIWRLVVQRCAASIIKLVGTQSYTLLHGDE